MRCFSGVILLCVYGVLSGCATSVPTKKTVSPARLQDHVRMFSEEFVPRDSKHVETLEQCAEYIARHFSGAGGFVTNQTFEVNGESYRNVIAFFGPETDSRIVVGAHYDGCYDTPGADDNASGVAGLIELAGLLGQAELKQQVELVAFTLEEPPYFRTEHMGSAHHAARLRAHDVDVEVMLCLEMIGYFSDAKNSQEFPSPFMKPFYPDTGNFIGVIGRFRDQKFAGFVKDAMLNATDLPVETMSAPESFPGLDFSDHLNYWEKGYAAIMITDTAFYRNPNYHQATDVADSLNFDAMAKVVLGVYEAVVHLSNDES